MYEIYVVAKDFKDKKTIQQHRIVNEVNVNIFCLSNVGVVNARL